MKQSKKIKVVGKYFFKINFIDEIVEKEVEIIF